MACDNIENGAVEACRAELQGELKSPSSLNIVEENAVFYEDGGLSAPAADMVKIFLTYDADNSFGASLRDMKVCYFDIVDGVIDPMNRYDGGVGE